MEKKVYITKWALTKGIKEAEARIEKSYYDESIEIAWVKGSMSCLIIGKDAFLNRDDAVKRANDMRLNKIKNLKIQIVKLEKMIIE